MCSLWTRQGSKITKYNDPQSFAEQILFKTLLASAILHASAMLIQQTLADQISLKNPEKCSLMRQLLRQWQCVHAQHVYAAHVCASVTSPDTFSAIDMPTRYRIRSEVCSYDGTRKRPHTFKAKFHTCLPSPPNSTFLDFAIDQKGLHILKKLLDPDGQEQLTTSPQSSVFLLPDSKKKKNR